VGLEHIEPQTGRRIGDVPIDLGSMTGRKARFLPGDIVYGYLRPYLNKVWIAEFAGFCSVDQYVSIVDEAVADRTYVASYLRRPAYLAAAPIDETPGQLPRIRIDEVLSTPIPLPPLEEQRRIAARLRDELGAVADFGPSIDRWASTLATLRRSALTTIFEQLLGERRSVGKLADVIKLRNDIVHPTDRPTGTAEFVGLEHIEAGSGRRIGQVPIDLAAMTGRKATFSPGNIVYGYLRPYLNKVWLADIDGFCSVDQYVLEVDARRADSDFVALFMLSDAYLSRAPITTTPGQLPRIRSGEVLSVPAPIPSLADQRRIAARLREQLAQIDRAKAALNAQRKAVDVLPAALLRDVFGPAKFLDR